MTRKDFNAETLTNGTALTTTNTGFNGLDGDSNTASNAHVNTGSMAYAFYNSTTAKSDVVINIGAGLTTMAFRFYIYMTGYPSQVMQFLRFDNSTGVQFNMNTNGTLTYSGSTTATPIPLNAWTRCEFVLDVSASTVTYNAYDATNTVVSNMNKTGVTIASNPVQAALGKVSTAALSVFYLDDIAIESGRSTEFGPANTPPNAGTDQTDILPFSTVTLTATDPDTGQTITWTQIGGTPTVTLSGTGLTRTFTAPATLDGTTLTFQVSDGTATDSVDVSVLKHLTWMSDGTQLVPTRWQTAS